MKNKTLYYSIYDKSAPLFYRVNDVIHLSEYLLLLIDDTIRITNNRNSIRLNVAQHNASRLTGEKIEVKLDEYELPIKIIFIKNGTIQSFSKVYF